ncbi:MAG: hypothetical protein JWM80_487 [Cyanobacteria bacterium RYN_339]|nr:hypothetical protein [Cyanobacteria bacterium RYN_339]
MSLKVLWTGMFQGAFKHQVLKKGVDDVYYLKRADFQLPIPPLPTLEVAPEAIPDLREVYGLAEDGTMYVMGSVAGEALVGDRRVRVLPAVAFGEPDDNLAPLDHELGLPFYGGVALGPGGRIVLVSNVPSFGFHDADGRLLHDHLAPGPFEAPADRPPFWLSGAGDVACGPEGFLVGGFPMNRVDQYAYDGRLLRSLRSFSWGGKVYDFETANVAKVAFCPDGRLLVSTTRQLFIFSAEGEIQEVVETSALDLGGSAADFHLWMAVDAQGQLWSQYYKGKEVAYAAFALPDAT